MTIGEYKKTAKEALRGQWGINAGIVFLTVILTLAISQVSTITRDSSLQSVLSFILTCTLAFPISYSLNYIALYVLRGGHAEIGQIFVVFSKAYYKPLFFINLFSQIVTFILSLVLFLPILLTVGVGIYVSLVFNNGVMDYSSISSGQLISIVGLYFVLLIVFLFVSAIIGIVFRFAVWLQFDYPELSTMDSLKQAWFLIKDRWFKYILLELSFIGWYILGFVFLFVGLLFVASYVNTASAAFYDQALKEKKIAA